MRPEVEPAVIRDDREPRRRLGGVCAGCHEPRLLLVRLTSGPLASRRFCQDCLDRVNAALAAQRPA